MMITTLIRKVDEIDLSFDFDSGLGMALMRGENLGRFKIFDGQVYFQESGKICLNAAGHLNLAEFMISVEAMARELNGKQDSGRTLISLPGAVGKPTTLDT
jgi:hypothetical protein